VTVFVVADERHYIEDSAIAFAIYCDEHGLSVAEGIAFAERLGEELESTATDRRFQADEKIKL
jgi:hypothetical protein